MAEYLIQDSTLSAIADAIREKTGKADTIAPEQMPTEIAGISGSDITIIDNVEVAPNFANGDYLLVAQEGYAVKGATILKPATLIPENIANGVEIAGVVGTLETGSSADVRYVTFMNGSTVLYKKPVAVGDDCVDVLTKGLIETPTKESTVQYDYTYYGWGASDGGAADANILKNITEDKTVYAVFTATVRMYTITYLDDDGVTVLKTESLAYGTVPSYVPSKDGASFSAWNPSPVAVTGDATYTATWLEKVTFANGTWADIARICEAGQAQENFKLGDERVITFNGTDITFYIAGFGHDELYEDSSVKAGITVLSKTAVGLKRSSDNQFAFFSDGLTGYLSYLPSDLQSVVKRVRKKYDKKASSTSVTVSEGAANTFVPSIIEMGKTLPTGARELGTAYAKVIRPSGYWWYRNKSTRNANGIQQWVNESGTTTTHYAKREYDTIVGFCI